MPNFCSHCGVKHSTSASVEETAPPVKTKKPRKVSAYSKRYGKHFKSLAPKNKKKNGSWKKNGFTRTQKQAHKAAKK
jgi:hypothetical protein